MARVIVSFRLEESLLAELDRHAEKTGETRTDILERAAQLGLRDMRELGDLLQIPVIGAVIAAVLKNPTSGEPLTPAARKRLDGLLNKRKENGGRGGERK